MAYAQAFGQSDGLVLVIDEPESHLHPLAQQWLASRLNQLATDGLQVVLTTHSPYFVDLSRPENLVLVRKPDGGATEAIQLSREQLVAELVAKGADAARTTTDSVGSFYEAAATSDLRSALFSRACVLVEGPTEALALPELLRRHGFDTLRHGIAFVSAVGIGNIAKWARLFAALRIPVYCVFDTDSNKSGNDAERLLAQRRDLLSAIDVDPTQAELGVMSTDPLWVGPKYATTAPNFESAMSAAFGSDWDSVYAESAEIVGEQSKPLRARYAAMNVAIDDDARHVPAIAQLAVALRSVTGDPSSDDPAAEGDGWIDEIDGYDIPDDEWDEPSF